MADQCSGGVGPERVQVGERPDGATYLLVPPDPVQHAGQRAWPSPPGNCGPQGCAPPRVIKQVLSRLPVEHARTEGSSSHQPDIPARGPRHDDSKAISQDSYGQQGTKNTGSLHPWQSICRPTKSEKPLPPYEGSSALPCTVATHNRPSDAAQVTRSMSGRVSSATPGIPIERTASPAAASMAGRLSGAAGAAGRPMTVARTGHRRPSRVDQRGAVQTNGHCTSM